MSHFPVRFPLLSPGRVWQIGRGREEGEVQARGPGAAGPVRALQAGSGRGRQHRYDLLPKKQNQNLVWLVEN